MRPSRARFAEVMRTEPVDLGLACVLVGGEVDHDLDVEGPLAVLDALASAAEPLVPPAGAPAAVAEGLRRALCEQAGFGPGSFDDISSSLLHEVLRRRCGLPLLLSVVWVEVATRLAIPAYAVGLP
ncbi:MAG: transglutaminase-like domain-containing protein, partial [Actinobacteria bacterium]|nr:transglutaminase-like domain-containing protein [Actinomycetota bacterium]